MNYCYETTCVTNTKAEHENTASTVKVFTGPFQISFSLTKVIDLLLIKAIMDSPFVWFIILLLNYAFL